MRLYPVLIPRFLSTERVRRRNTGLPEFMNINVLRAFLGIVFLSTVSDSLAVPVGQLADSPWPDYGGGLTNSHQTSAVGPSGNVQLLWEYEVPQIRGSFNQPFRQPVLGGDGTIYFGTFTNREGQLTALHPDGTPQWVQVGNAIGFWPAVDSRGRIYHEGYRRTNGRGPLYSRNQSDGVTRWTTPQAFGPFESGPTIGIDGTIYSAVGGLTAYNFDGTELWNFPVTENQYRNPAISSGGTIYIGGQFEVIAVDAAGNEVWSYPANTRLGPVTIGDDGNLFVGSANALSDKLISLTPNGDERWVRSGVGGAVALGLDGTVYAGYRGTLHAIDPDTGNDIWTFATGQIDEAGVEGVTVDGNGYVYLANKQGMLMSLTPEGDLRWEFDIAPDENGNIWPSAPIIGENGVIYVGGGTTRSFFAIGVPEPSSVSIAFAALCLAVAFRIRPLHGR